MRYSNDPAQIGSKLGPKMVHIISETIVATKRKLLDTEHRARVNSIQTVIDRAGREVADLYRPVWEETLAEQDIPDVIREHIEKIMSGNHQWQAVAGMAFGASGTSSALSTIISNFLAPGVRAAVSRDPQLAPSPESMAQLGARGVFPLGEVHDLSHGAGYSDDIVTALVEAARAWPDISTSLELLRRQVISRQEAIVYLQRNGVAPQAIPQLLRLQEIVISPADLADMAVRGIKTEAQAAVIAAESGVSASDFHDLTLITGEPPGLEQLLEGYRRGFIDRATLERGIRESRYRNEWIPLLEQLRFSPMSVADAVNAVVQNHLTAAQGEAISQLNGLEPGQFAILQETAGEPLSRTEMQELYNRGLVTRAEVDQAQRESRLKDKYIPLSFELHRRIIPIFTLQKALKAGAVDHATAVSIAMESGYNQRDAEIITASGAADKTLTYKNRVVSAIETSYEDNTIPRDQAVALIKELGFETSEADFILQAAEFRRSARIVNGVANNVKSKYISRHITRNQASNDLDAIGIPAPQRDFMLSLWDIELDANTRHLTEAQVVKAVKLQLITEAQGLARLVNMGYDTADADLLLKGA
jgi:hypothetical protein